MTQLLSTEFHLDPSGSDPFRPFTAIFSIDPAAPTHVTIRFENDSEEGDKSIFIDSLVLHEGHAWTVDEVCSSEWSSWQLATPSVLAGLPRGADYQYKYQDTDSGAYYLTPVTQLVWAWDRFQGLSGEYMFETADGVTDSFLCTDTEQGMVGVGCSNGGGAQWKAFSWVRG